MILKRKVVELEWIDVMSLDTSLVYPEDLKGIKPSHAWIVGFLFKEDKDFYWLPCFMEWIV